MATNKVIYGTETLIDLSQDTLTSADQLKNGVKAHDRAGNQITGTYTEPTFATVYSGSNEPASSLGSNGDIYVVI